MAETISGHGGVHVVAAAQAHGVSTMFTLSGGHIFPIYDGAVHADPPLRMIDVRAEHTAVFAAEATGKLTRSPGLAVVTAGPGVTNAVSPITQAYFAGSPLVVLGGRAATANWGKGSLQELDHPPLLASVTKRAGTVESTATTAAAVDDAFRLAATAHRGPVFLDFPIDQLFTPADAPALSLVAPVVTEPDPDAVTAIARLLGQAHRPVLVLGSDVWLDGAEEAALRFVDETGIPVVTNGMGRGVVPASHPALVTKARSAAFGRCDLAVVVGAPLDFRLGYGGFGGREGAPAAAVVHLADSPEQVARHVDLAASASGTLSRVFDDVLGALTARPDWSSWAEDLRSRVTAAVASDAAALAADADPIHPARIYGELLPRLAEDAVVIGDGGDFVSFAGKYVEPRRPGGWLDPGPYGCLGAGTRLRRSPPGWPARRRRSLLLLGDGAAGMSLLDVDTLVRHRLPVVMVLANNRCWALEKHPMRFLYGYDVCADLRATPYDEVVAALGGAGETVTRPDRIGPALDRAFAASDSGVPYLVNVHTDTEVAYPRSTTGL